MENKGIKTKAKLTN